MKELSSPEKRLESFLTLHIDKQKKKNSIYCYFFLTCVLLHWYKANYERVSEFDSSAAGDPLNRYSFLLEPPRIGRGAPVPETHGRKGGDERQHVFQRGPGGMKNSGIPPGFSFG